MRHALIKNALDNLPCVIKYDYFIGGNVTDDIYCYNVSKSVTVNNKIITLCNKGLMIWDLINKNEVVKPTTYMINIAVLPDNRIVTLSQSKQLFIWAFKDQSLYLQYTHNIGASSHLLYVLPNGYIVTAYNYNNGDIEIWRIKGQHVMTLQGHTQPVTCFLLWNDLLISGSADESIRIWDYTIGICKYILRSHKSYIQHLALLSEGRFMSFCADRTINIWDKDAILENTIIAYNPTLRLTDGTQNMDTVTDDITRTHNTVLIEYTPRLIITHNHKIISACADNSIRVWDNIKCIVLNGHTGKINDLIILPNNNLLSISKDKTIRIWDLEKYICINVFNINNSDTDNLIVWNDRVIINGQDSVMIDYMFY